MILRILFYLFLAYLLYKFLFGFVIPVYKATRKMKAGFREMSARMNQSDGNERMHEQMHQANFQQEEPVKKNKAEKPGEYIDFEEVKD